MKVKAVLPSLALRAGGFAIYLLSADLDGDLNPDLASAAGRTNRFGVLWRQTRPWK